MTITAKVIADSADINGKRVTTMLLRYPRFIHSEFMTHRVFSRCASSSRAIPVERIIESIKDDPAMPVHWGRNQAGMQAEAELCKADADIAKLTWLKAMHDVIARAHTLTSLGVHKQVVNRMLEPWSHINVVVTSTEWDNFFALRIHPDAQPEIKELASAMKVAMDDSTPVTLISSEWHLPFIEPIDRKNARDYLKLKRTSNEEPSTEKLNILLCKISSARCARTSYMLHSGKPSTIEKDLALFDTLSNSIPIHASPMEHPCRPAKSHNDVVLNQRNLIGYVQFRVFVEEAVNESR